MTVPHAAKSRFAIERILQPRSVAVLGAETSTGRLIMANLQAGAFTGSIMPVPTGGDIAALPDAPDLAVIASPPADIQAVLHALAARGVAGAVVTTQVADLGPLAQAAGIRVLGPSSFGIASPGLRLNASLSHMPIPAGGIALVTQSASLSRAIVDWAGPNGVGFSHVVGIGGNTDIGFSLVLDWLSRDPATKLILLDIRRVRGRRAFISAARAASRLRPVVALRPGGRLLDPSGRSNAVFNAALNRAGVFVVQQMDALLAAAETLSRSRPLRGEAMAIVTNAIGPGRLAADAALEAGISLAILPPEAQLSLTATMPADLFYGLIYAGSAAPTDIASIAAMVSTVPEVGGVLVLLTPTGPPDAAAIEAVIAAAHTASLPVLTCVMGETTGAALRRRLAEAGLPAFATPEQAVQAFGHLLRDRRARQSARELPPGTVLDIDPNRDAVDRILATATSEHRLALSTSESRAILGAYGLHHTEPPMPGALLAALSVHDDETFGPAIGLSVPPDATPCYDLPPLNLSLSQSLACRTGLHEAAHIDAVAQALVRISQLLVDRPAIDTIDIAQLSLDGAHPAIHNATIRLRSNGANGQLAISPYPNHLAATWTRNGETFLIRPIRPEDAAAHAALIARIPREDLRYRFFTALREVAPEHMARLTQIDYDREMAFIAVHDTDQSTVGVARLVREIDAHRGEFAILVQPNMKGIGLARHLMERLIAWARSQGVETITGQVLSDNAPMIGFMRRLGFSLHRVPDDVEILEAALDIQH